MKNYTKTIALLLITAVAAQAQKYYLEMNGYVGFTQNRFVFGSVSGTALGFQQPVSIKVSFDLSDTPDPFSQPGISGYRGTHAVEAQDYSIIIGDPTKQGWHMDFNGYYTSQSHNRFNFLNNGTYSRLGVSVRPYMVSEPVSMFGVSVMDFQTNFTTPDDSGNLFETLTLSDLLNIELSDFSSAGWNVQSPEFVSNWFTLGGPITSIQVYPAAIPEPSTFAAVAGVGVLALAATRRRRRMGA